MNKNTFRNRIVEHGTKPADQFQANPLNYRKHPQRQRDAMRASLTELGWIGIVVENRQTGNLIDGHERVWQAMENNEDVPYIQVDLSEEEERLALAVFDPITYMAETDAAILEELLKEVETVDPALQALLDGMAEDAGIVPDAGEPVDAEPQIDRAEELRQKWAVEPGSLWVLDSGKGHPHRLICGDCTDADVVGRVMGGEKADMVFTDPPYNLASENNLIAADVSAAINGLKDAAWDHDFELRPALDSILSVACPNVSVYVCSSHHLAPLIWAWMKEWADHYSWCVWHKPNPMPSLMKRHWTWDAELIPYATRGKHIFNFPEEGHAPAMWSITKHKLTDHPTEKPVEVPAHAIRHSSKPGAIVFDVFLGSGTTIIAAEQLARRCYACEIDAGYVAVALERFAVATGIEPVRIENAPAASAGAVEV